MHVSLLSYAARVNILRDEKFHRSHGADQPSGYLGMGLLYYTIPYVLRAKTCVCLGSGSGFVPRLMRQAQVDSMPLPDIGVRTVLVDANIPGWGDPDYHDGPTFFTKNFDVQVVKKTTTQAAPMFGPGAIDYLHVDANHSYEYVHEDVQTYMPRVRPGGFITLHDSVVHKAGVPRVVDELRRDKRLEVLSFPFGMGTTVVRKRDRKA